MSSVVTTNGGWWVYVLRCADRTLYTGVTTDIQRRVDDHNCGRGARYTRARLPVRLMYFEASESRSAALRREFAIKAMPRREKLRLIRSQPARKPIATPSAAK